MAIISNDDEIKQLIEAGYRAEYGLRSLSATEHTSNPNRDMARTFYRRAMDKGSRIACILHMNVMTSAQIDANKPSHDAVGLYWNNKTIQNATASASRDDDIGMNKHFWWSLVVLYKLSRKRKHIDLHQLYGQSACRSWTKKAASLHHAEAIFEQRKWQSSAAPLTDEFYHQLCFAACTEQHSGCAKHLLRFEATNNGAQMVTNDDTTPLALAYAAFLKRTVLAQTPSDEVYLRTAAMETHLAGQQLEDFVALHGQMPLSIELAPRRLINRSEMIHIAQRLSERLSDSELNEVIPYGINIARNCRELLASNAEYVIVV